MATPHHNPTRTPPTVPPRCPDFAPERENEGFDELNAGCGGYGVFPTDKCQPQVEPDQEGRAPGTGIFSPQMPSRATFTTAELLALHQRLCDEARDLMRKKNADYAGTEGDDPFRNFKMSEYYGVCSSKVNIFNKMSDKFSRLATFVKNGRLQVTDETSRDIILDLINYGVIILAKAMEEERTGKSYRA